MDILTVLISLIYEHRIFYLFMSSSVSFIKVMWFLMYRSFISLIKYIYWDFPGGTNGKELAFQSRRLRDPGSIPGSGRSPGEGHGNPLQYSYLENPMDGGALQAMVCRVTRGWTWLKWLITTALIVLLTLVLLVSGIILFISFFMLFVITIQKSKCFLNVNFVSCTKFVDWL